MKVYFAHPISSYGSPEEARVIAALTANGFEVVNPSGPEHATKVDALRASHPDREETSRRIMDYFVELCGGCDGCVVMPFPDGRFGAGVVKEAQSFLDRGKSVLEVFLGKDIIALNEIRALPAERCLDVPATRAMLAALKPKP